MTIKTEMNRRSFVLAAAAVAAGLGATATATPAFAKTVKYTPSKFDKFIAAGKPFMIGVHADWCSTCDRQKRVINALRAQGAPYSNLTIMEVDWDKERGGAFTTEMNIPRRSTLIMFNGGKEVGRIVAGTGSKDIQSLIDKGFKGS